MPTPAAPKKKKYRKSLSTRNMRLRTDLVELLRKHADAAGKPVAEAADPFLRPVILAMRTGGK